MELQNEVVTDVIPIIDHSGTKLIVGLDDTWHDPFGTRDSEWFIKDGGSAGEYLKYINANNVPWEAKCHCEWDGHAGFTKTWAEIRQPGGGGKDVPGLLIRDWEGRQWTIQLLGPRNKDGHGRPSFRPYNRILDGY